MVRQDADEVVVSPDGRELALRSTLAADDRDVLSLLRIVDRPTGP